MKTRELVETVTDDVLHSLVQSTAGNLDGPVRTFARWLALHKGHPRIAAQLGKLQEVTGFEWTEAQRQELYASGAFRTYYLAIKEQGLRAMRFRTVEVAAKSVEMIDWGLDEAKKKGDYRAIPGLASPVMERAWPRREDMAQAAPTVIIQITQAQHAQLEAPPAILEAEIIEVIPVDESSL